MSQGNCVYVVDDDVTLLQSLGRLLRSLGYTSLLFPSAETFTKHDDFDKAACILLDINIGEVSGIEVAHRLKAANVSVPIIFMTGNDQPVLRGSASIRLPRVSHQAILRYGTGAVPTARSPASGRGHMIA